MNHGGEAEDIVVLGVDEFLEDFFAFLEELGAVLGGRGEDKTALGRGGRDRVVDEVVGERGRGQSRR